MTGLSGRGCYVARNAGVEVLRDWFSIDRRGPNVEVSSEQRQPTNQKWSQRLTYELDDAYIPRRIVLSESSSGVTAQFEFARESAQCRLLRHSVPVQSEAVRVARERALCMFANVLHWPTLLLLRSAERADDRFDTIPSGVVVVRKVAPDATPSPKSLAECLVSLQTGQQRCLRLTHDARGLVESYVVDGEPTIVSLEEWNEC